MKVSTIFRRLCIAACAFAVAVAWADPPGRVGRITYIEGTVSFFGERDDGWRKAQVNYPVTSENSLWTEGNARSEVRIGPSAIRIDSDAVFDFVKLEDHISLGFLQRGSINVRLRQFDSPDARDLLQIDTREGRFTLEGNGRYRLDVSGSGNESRISVFSGSARFDASDNREMRQTIDAGKQLTVRIAGSATDFRYDTALDTAFDRWAADRDRQWDQTHQRYAITDTRETLISPYMTGYEDLDANGDWIDDNEYGRLWTPRVVVTGWAPYRYGRWSYVRPWGWTWIDDAPWGFAPFHYGRWVQVRSRWCWWPGPYIGRPVYAPALVAWFGSAGHVFTLSTGPAVGWFPLAPREYYVPRYTTNIHYIRQINYVTSNTTPIIPPSRYRNQVPGATIVPSQIFIGGNPVGGHHAHVPAQTISGHAVNASLDIPRPPRSLAGQMPDRRQDSRPVAPPPRPWFAHEASPPPTPGPAHPAPGGLTPKYRTPEPGTSGPLPGQKAAPMAAPGPAGPSRQAGQAGAINMPPAAIPPAPSSRTRPTPTPLPPQPANANANANANTNANTNADTNANGSGMVRVDPPPVGRERESRTDSRSDVRPPPTRGGNRSQPDGPNPPAAIAVPFAVPHQPTTHPQSVTKDNGSPLAKPAPGNVIRPRHDVPVPAETGTAKPEIKERQAKPGIPKD